MIIHFEIIEDTAKVQRSNSGEEGTLPVAATDDIADSHSNLKYEGRTDRNIIC